MARAFLVREATNRALRALNYSPEVEAFRAQTGRRHVRLGALLASLGPAYGSVFTRLDCAPGHGVELITQGDMFAAEPAGRTIRLDSMARPERHRVRRWQVLIAGAGTLGENELYGRSIIADGRLVDRFVGPHAMVLTFADEGGPLNLYTYAFLCTAIGIRAIRSASFGTKILGIRKDILSELPVPLPDDAIVARVSALIVRAVEKRELFTQRLASARAVLDEMPEMLEAQAQCAIRRARCVTWGGPLATMNAWTFASSGGALGHLGSKWKRRLSDVLADGGLFNGPRFARVAVQPPNGIEFMSQRDVFLIRPVPRRIAHPGFSPDKLFVPRGSILVGGHGTLGEGEIFGRCVFVTDRLSRSGFTQDLLRIHPQPGEAESVFAFLSTRVGLRLLRACAVGTKILSLRPDLLAALPLPDLSAAQARRVRSAVVESCEAREDAEAAESEAIRIIEEEVLPQWLA